MTTRIFSASLLLVGLVGLGSACSSNSDSASAPCSNYVKALRSYSERCSTSPIPAERWAELEQRYALACDNTLLLPGTSVNQVFIDKCARALDATACGLSSPLDCQPPAGTLAEGSKCSSSDQCASTYCNTSGSTTGCGTCAKTVAVGGACTPSDRCVRGSSCLSGTCTAPTYNGVGGVCDSTVGQYCQTNLICDSATKTCKELPKAGEACPSYICATGFTCDGTTKTCFTPTKVGAGQPCGGTSKNVCDANLTCKSGVCAVITWVKPGGDCSVAGTQCLHGSCLAATKVCPPVLADGAACDSTKPEAGICNDLASCIAGKCLLSGSNRCG